VTTASAPADGSTRRPSRPVVLLIPVPGRSTIHDLWAGTKLLVVFGVSVLLTFYPGWVTIGLVAALVGIAVIATGLARGRTSTMRSGAALNCAKLGATIRQTAKAKRRQVTPILCENPPRIWPRIEQRKKTPCW